jgi:hypothetical protein
MLFARSQVASDNSLENQRMRISIQIYRTLGMTAIVALAAPANAAPTETAPAGNDAAPDNYQTLRSLGHVKHRAPRRVSDPKNPTWEDYMDVANQARIARDMPKAAKYAQASYATLVKSVQANPNQQITRKYLMFANELCTNTMAVEGDAILAQDVSKLSDPEELAELVAQEEKHFGAMQTAYSVLKRISPSGAAQVAFEMPKCSAAMAKAKAKLEKAQAEAKSETKTQ